MSFDEFYYNAFIEKKGKHKFAHVLSSTTIYLWLISLTASKELSILLLKLLKCMEQSVYRLIHLGLRVRYRD